MQGKALLFLFKVLITIERLLNIERVVGKLLLSSLEKFEKDKVSERSEETDEPA